MLNSNDVTDNPYQPPATESTVLARTVTTGSRGGRLLLIGGGTVIGGLIAKVLGTYVAIATGVGAPEIFEVTDMLMIWHAVDFAFLIAGSVVGAWIGQTIGKRL